MIESGILLLLAVLPVIIILTFVYSKDKRKEPVGLLISFFGRGIFSCFLVLSISDVLSKFLPFMNKEIENMAFIEVIIYSFICVALVEEFCKWLMVYFKGYNHREFDELYDILVYSLFVSLGFAFFENILYVFSSGTIMLALVRAISAIPGHACDAVFMGYYLSLAKQCKCMNKKDLEKQNILKSIFIPTLLHGIYDFCVMAGYEIFVIIFIVFVIYLYIISIKKLNKLAKANKQLNERPNNVQSNRNINERLNNVEPPINVNYCVKCGEKLHGQFCIRCGTKNY